MDFISTAVQSLGAHMALQRTQLQTSLVKKTHEYQQSVVGLVAEAMNTTQAAAPANTGPTYNASGSVSASAQPGSLLNVTA